MWLFSNYRQIYQIFPLLFCVTSNSVEAASTSYVPDSEAEVIANLSSAEVQLAARMRAENTTPNSLGNQNGSPDPDLRQVLEAYNLASGSNNPRVYGYTLTLISSWQETAEVPVLVRLIKAAVLQHGHEFSAALDELALVTAIDPENWQALQMQSQITLVTGDYAAARRYCNALDSAGHVLLASNCLAQVDGLTGAAEAALIRVESLLSENHLEAAQALEFHITAASLAQRLARPVIAEQHFRTALMLNPQHSYLLVNYADWLLNQSRAADAASLLQAHADDQNQLELQLIYAQALIESKQGEVAKPLLLTLKETFSALSRRETERPNKLLARYALLFSGDLELAHRAALLNWQIQKEPSDALLLARSALAAGELESLQLLAQWRGNQGLQDRRLDVLLSEAGLL